MQTVHSLISSVADFSHSSQAKLFPVGVNAVTLTDSFWLPRLEINRNVTLPSQYRHCEDTNRFDNFRRASGRKKDIPFVGIYFNDSDVYKWLEAASFALGTHPGDLALNAMVDTAIDEIVAAQGEDGYLNTYFTLDKADQRWTNFDLHEMYCLGHMIQAAVAHYRATGEKTLLAVATKAADYLHRTFGPNEGQRHGFDGHEEIELALVELYRATSEPRYLELAQYFLNVRGTKPTNDDRYWHYGSAYHQDHVPYRDIKDVTGHAVRMMYLACGAADVYAETGDVRLKAAMDAQWENMTTRRMYVTGGLGARWEGEAFGRDYELPSDRAYTETCAAIGGMMWDWRLLQLTGDAKYADLFEWTLYNAMLPGLSLDGKEYFYQNPLSDDGGHRRQPWFGCACCPPNVARTLASLTGYFYFVSDKAVWTHLYAAGTATLALPGGETVGLTQTTNYPWNGDITLTVTQAPATPITLNLRVPAWADEATISVNGEAPQPIAPGYAALTREWNAGDTVQLTLPMPVRTLAAHPYAADPAGSLALTRGPLVYCLEQADHGATDVRDITLASHEAVSCRFDANLLGGVAVLETPGKAVDRSEWEGHLYLPAETLDKTATRPVPVTAIPYFAWANRAAGPMRVWIGRG